jgi:D-alanyl-D-alanine carboxypeptidase
MLKSMKKIVILCIAIAVLLGGGALIRHTVLAPDNKKSRSPAPTFNKQLYSTNDPKSIWVVVNKQRQLRPKGYAPQLMVPKVPLRLPAGDGEMHVSTQMAPSLEKLFTAANNAGAPLRLASGYRSYQEQVTVYGAEVQNFGQAKADQESARPGFSEHQTGLAADLEPLDRSCEVTTCFANTPQGKWLAQNAYKYGFIIRYTKNKVGVTGYEYEPWHVRYIGMQLSNELHRTGIETLEEFFDLPGGASY